MGLVEQLASRALTSGKRKVRVRRDAEGRILGAETSGEGLEHGAGGAAVKDVVADGELDEVAGAVG